MNAAAAFVSSYPRFERSLNIDPEAAFFIIRREIPALSDSLATDIAELVDMFCYLFDLERAGLRLATLDRAMCPRFHVDRVPCRLVTTYQGVATEWLPHDAVDRTQLGPAINVQSESESAMFSHQRDTQHLTCGDVALLKGELWPGNENAGLVHRSPAVPADENRLLLTLDVSS